MDMITNTACDFEPIGKLLNANEVATRLNISLALAYRLMQENAMPVVRINRAVRVREEDLMDFIMRNRTTS
jgi:excisionase family DNA binding protein